MTMLEQAQRGVGMAGRGSHLFFPGWKASAVSRTVGWFPENTKGRGPYKGVQPSVHPLHLLYHRPSHQKPQLSCFLFLPWVSGSAKPACCPSCLVPIFPSHDVSTFLG